MWRRDELVVVVEQEQQQQQREHHQFVYRGLSGVSCLSRLAPLASSLAPPRCNRQIEEERTVGGKRWTPLGEVENGDGKRRRMNAGKEGGRVEEGSLVGENETTEVGEMGEMEARERGRKRGRGVEEAEEMVPEKMRSLLVVREAIELGAAERVEGGRETLSGVMEQGREGGSEEGRKKETMIAGISGQIREGGREGGIRKITSR